MRNLKLLFCILLVFTFCLALASCQGDAVYYTVEFDSQGGSEIQSRAIESGSSFAEPDAPQKAGYIFGGWYNGETKWNFATDTVNSDLTLTAKWEKISYTVTFNTDGGTSVASQTVYDGETVTEPANPTKENARFIGWYNGLLAWDFEFGIVKSDITLTAKWDPIITYTVTFDSDGGSAVESQYPEKGTKVNEPTAPTKASHNFLGWYNGKTEWDFENDTVSSNITLKAKWQPIYTVSFDSNGGSAVEPQYIVDGLKATEPTEPTKATHIFDGWYNGSTKWDFENDTVNSNVTLTAKWKAIYTVTFNSDGGSSVASQDVVEGKKATEPTAPNKASYKFAGWYNGNTKWNFSTNTVNSNITLTAKWDPAVTYTVTFNSDGGSAVESMEIPHGEKIPIPTVIMQNAFLEGWFIDGTDIEWNFETDVVTGPITLKAEWIITLPQVPL